MQLAENTVIGLSALKVYFGIALSRILLIQIQLSGLMESTILIGQINISTIELRANAFLFRVKRAKKDGVVE